MSTTVVVNTYTHTATYVASKLLLSIKEIVRESGLDPAKLSDQWVVLERGVSTWLESRHLRAPKTGNLGPLDGAARHPVGSRTSSMATPGMVSLWTDTAALRYSIVKAGAIPARCNYRVIANDGRRAGRLYRGWADTTLRSTEGFTRYTVGSTIGGNGIGAGVSYWVKS
jgi:hypothetical protein